MALSPDGGRLLTGSDDKTAKVWDISSGELFSSPNGPKTDRVVALAFQPGTGRIVVGGDGNPNLVIVDLESRKVINSAKLASTVTSIEFLENPSEFMTADRSGVVRQYELISDDPELTYAWDEATRVLSLGWDRVSNLDQWHLEVSSFPTGPWESLTALNESGAERRHSIPAQAQGNRFYRLSRGAN